MTDSEYLLYDQVLLGRKETFGKELFETTVNGRKEYNPADEGRALKIIRYAFEYYLGWTPEDVMRYISPGILKTMKLDGIVRQRIRFPVELEPMENLQYLVSRMYPERYRYNEWLAVQTYYDRVLRHEISRFKQNFFSGEDGDKRAAICLRRMLQLVGPFSKMEDVYEAFTGTKARRMLTRYKLYNVSRALYKYPVDFLHYSLPEGERDDFLYNKYRFKDIDEMKKKEAVKEGLPVRELDIVDGSGEEA